MPVLDETARGVFLIAVTPFTDDGALDLPSTDRVVDFYLERGVDGLTLLGVMGEAPKLTAAKSRNFVRRVLDRVAGRVPVIVGVPAAGLAPMRELASEVMAAGAAGVMVAAAAEREDRRPGLRPLRGRRRGARPLDPLRPPGPPARYGRAALRARHPAHRPGARRPASCSSTRTGPGPASPSWRRSAPRATAARRAASRSWPATAAGCCCPRSWRGVPTGR